MTVKSQDPPTAGPLTKPPQGAASSAIRSKIEAAVDYIKGKCLSHQWEDLRSELFWNSARR
jgi:hypothetical protein